ncbi:secreted RxLR effector protein 161-like [Rosa chinensis]|uniref:secreted RxLR effector protein 161-like n=1 Tax=Rosa chinensis TaxID=74649 RepID=UPI000D091FE3|nr:secreted RxLR effector protein 161-like [Rosa chinensis]
MTTCLRDGTAKPIVRTDGTVKYPLPRALLTTLDFAEPTSYTEASKQQVSFHNHGLHISQIKYAYDLLVKLDMLLSEPVSTQLSAKAVLTATEGNSLANLTSFLEIVGSLQYLTITSPDIAFAMNSISQFMSHPYTLHLIAAKRILHYIKGTLAHGLFFSQQHQPAYLAAYSDADWAVFPDTRRSTSGYLYYLGTNLISWCSKKQPTITCSSTESEYQALSHASAETTWLTFLLYELGSHIQFLI